MISGEQLCPEGKVLPSAVGIGTQARQGHGVIPEARTWRSLMSSFSARDTVRRTDRPPMPDFFGDATQDGEDRFGSSHSGGMNAVLADGSERFVNFSIDKTLFTNLGDKSDGQVVSSSDF